MRRLRARAASAIVFGGIAGGVGAFLNLTKWYVMKDRSGTVGAKGVATAVRELHDTLPGHQNPSRRPQPRRAVDGELREGA